MSTEQQPLAGLAADVDPKQVQGLLLNRGTKVVIDPDHRQHPMYVEILKGVATEVAAIVGSPVKGDLRNLAIWCVTLGTAMHVEMALHPEQGNPLSDDARAQQLEKRFLGVMAQLRSIATDSPTPPLEASPGPSGCFPPAMPYPDPVERWASW